MSAGNLKSDSLGDLDVDGRVTLKRILNCLGACRPDVVDLG